MQQKHFKMDRGDGNELDVYAERFSSLAEVAEVCRARPAPNDYNFKEHDYFNETWGNSMDYGSWQGFGSKEEFDRLIRIGVEDTQAIKSLAKCALTAEVQEKDKLCRTVHDVAGGVVDVPMMLSGAPNCMVRTEKKKVRSKIINIGIQTEVIGDISADTYYRAGMVLARTIAKLEKAGYRIGIQAMTAFASCSWTDRVVVLSAAIKKEYAPMNYSRMLMPLTMVAFDRGVGWAWLGRNPDYGSSNYGCYSSSVFEGNVKEKEEEMFAKASGLKDFIVFTHKDMIKVLREQGEEGLERYIEARIME